MGRIREFEDIKVFEKAMHLFWKKGYGNTSLKDLLEVMEIQNGSFYNTFGSKKALFINALESYEKDFAQKRNLLFESGNGFKKNIRILFSHVFDRQKKTECPKGCFLFNSVSADALEDSEIQTLVHSGVRDFENFLKDQIKIAIDNGEIDKSIEPNKTAAILIAYMQGIMKLCVLEFSDSKFKEQTKYFLAALNL